MDRRTVLAFVLIFLIVIGSDILMRRLRPAPPPPTAELAAEPAGNRASFTPSGSDRAHPDEDSAVAAPAVAVADSATADPGTVTLAKALAIVPTAEPARTVVVETPLYRVTLSTHGARIVSWRSLLHLDVDGEPVELIPQGAEAATAGDDAVAFVGANLDLGQVVFVSDAPDRIALRAGDKPTDLTLRTRTQGDLEILKTYTFDPGSYAVTVGLAVATAGPRASEASRLIGSPISARFAWPQGIASTERKSNAEQAAFKSFAKVGDDLHARNRKDIGKDADKTSARLTGSVRFATVQNKYFIVAGILPQAPDQTVEGTVVLAADASRHQQTWAIEAPLRAPSTGSGIIAASRLTTYIGPQEADTLRAFGLGLEKTMELGWTLFRPLAEGVLWTLEHMYRVISNYGVVIIIFSVLMKLVFWPLTRTSTQSMKKMQALQPKIQELQQKYKDNREKLSQETMKLYQKEKVNPMAGCLPMLVQMPVFIALYQALAHTIALRGAPFALWMDDLSQPDALFTLPFSVPFLGNEFNVLPILMSASMWVQTKITPTANMGGQMALMNTLMPVIFLFMFYQMPSGLVLYWLVVNIMSIYQTWRIHATAPRTGGVEAA